MVNRHKMSKEERAKQFMPFAALKGFELAIAEKEKPVICKVEISEDRKDELDMKLREINVHSIASIVYYNNGAYIRKTGMVAKIDTSARYIRIVNTKIAFSDIYDITILD